VLIAANVVLSLNTLVSRYVSPLEQAVLSIGTIHGGVTSNILASQVEMKATLRTTSDEVRGTLLKRIRAIVEGVPPTFGGTGEMAVSFGYEALVNHDEAVDEVRTMAEAMLGADRITWKEKPSMGVEDFAFLVKARPGAFYHLGCGNADRGITAPAHSAAFDIDEDCLVLGAAMQAGLAMAYLDTGANP